MLLVAGIFSVCLMSCWAYIWSDPPYCWKCWVWCFGEGGFAFGHLVWPRLSRCKPHKRTYVFSFWCARFVTPRCLLYVFIGHTFWRWTTSDHIWTCLWGRQMLTNGRRRWTNENNSVNLYNVHVLWSCGRCPNFCLQFVLPPPATASIMIVAGRPHDLPNN